MSDDPPQDEDWAAAINLKTAAKALQAINDDDGGEQQESLPRVEGYLIEKRIGSGGGGTVYLAVRSGSQRRLALKILNHRLGETPQSKRAWRELDVLAQLHQPAIPRLIDYGEHGGRLYLATEFIEGFSLLEHCRRNELDREQQVELMARVCDAVQGVHEHGVIHRDLKPTNVLIDLSGQPMLIDFGLASLLNSDVQETLTIDGSPIGSPAFMAPEQARGETTSTLSDVYGLGATAYSVLLGDTPHAMNVTLHEAIRRVAHDPPRDPRELDARLPKPLAAVLHKAVAPRAGDRYASAAEFAADLRRWRRREPVQAGGPSLTQMVTQAAARHPVLSTMILCAVAGGLVLGSTVASVWWLNTRPATMERAQDSSWARLRSYNGRILHEWQPGRPRQIALSKIVQAKHGKLVILGITQSFGFDATCQLYAYETRDLKHPIWASGTGPPDIMMPPPISQVEDGPFKLLWAKTAEVFDESPGQEIIAVHSHSLYSPNLIRVYGLDGTVLYQVWHDGALGDGLWIPERRLLVLSGLNSENNWGGRGFEPTASDMYPHVLFAVKINFAEINDAWIRTPGGLGTVEPAWYRCLLPQPAVARLTRQGEFRIVLKRAADYDSRRDDPTFLYLLWPDAVNLWIVYKLNEAGIVIGGAPEESYREARSTLDLPDGEVFYFGDLPPLLVNPLDPTKPNTSGQP